MPRSNRPGWIEWHKSRAKEIVMYDLLNGILSTDDNDPTPREAWESQYMHLVEFVQEGVVFDQFKERLIGHRKQVRKMDERAMWELAAYEHDREIHPRNPLNARGITEFDQSSARDLLREDVKNGIHLTMSAAQLRQTRDEYRPPFLTVDDRKWRELVKQVSRLYKYYNYRDEKEAKQSHRTWVHGDPQPGRDPSPPPPPPPPPPEDA